ncbi:SDR family NAD(P)-dependent oxidoreductase [Salinactinospora qingdaonensis]|uniref:Short-chain dehydrogenase n=1 Tax=Salinactinospora qingdaonensis TaxID=702744 RepID=A0ABP7FRS2_9ACTN
MEIAGTRVLVTGATGVLGSGLVDALWQAKANVALAGRDRQRLTRASAHYGDAPTLQFDAMDLERCSELAAEAAGTLGGLDAVVVAHGIAAFGAATDEDDADNEQLMLVNALSPMAVLRGAVPHVGPGGTLAAISAVLVDTPTAGMAAYSASKAALSAWLSALRGELRRRKVSVLDIRAPHMATGLVERPIAGSPPRVLPRPFDQHEFFATVLKALGDRTAVLHYDAKERSLQPA